MLLNNKEEAVRPRSRRGLSSERWQGTSSQRAVEEIGLD